MTTFWRISEYADLGGQGGRIGSARWHTRGRAVVYLTESTAGAMLERLVHILDMNGSTDITLPRSYQLLRVQVADELAIKPLNVLAPVDWREDLRFTRSLGDAWLASMETALARVPSAIAPYTWNYLLNPTHPDAAKVQIAEAMRQRFDNRLFRFGGR
jgi:RES domain-containing protein